VAFTPDVYAAAVAIVAPSNLITLLESIPAYWEAARTVFHKRMGNPGTPEGKAQLERQSPLNSAEKIKTPLLVVQGANDPRVNKRESDQIVIALRDRGFPVEYLVAPDEGHGFARPVNNMAMFVSAEKFLAKHLGGRYQEGGTEEVMTRLKEITVDPKSVVLAAKVDAKAVGVPKVEAPLIPGTYKYAANISMGQQKIDIGISTEIKESEAGWTVTDTITMPMGEVSETGVLDKSTLTPVKRNAKQGPMTLEWAWKDNKVEGTLTVNNQPKPINVDVGGSLFADGPGAGFVLGTLPLAQGYSTSYRNFDVQALKVKLMQLKVAGTEEVTVPAGTFAAHRIEISSADGGSDKMTVWIAKDSRKPVKSSAIMSQMGGATLTIELQ